MSDWWHDHPEEGYWCEITDRSDIGADLKCPQTNEAGARYWSYSFINEVTPSDIVFHYSTRAKAFVGASVAGAPLEERPIVWIPHGTVGRAKRLSPEPRPGWWLPLYHFARCEQPLKLDELQTAEEQEFIRGWISEHGRGPFQPYPARLRASQGYLTKMPNAFVERWQKLSSLVDILAETREELARIAFIHPSSNRGSNDAGTFKPKNDEDYVAVIRSGVQVRSRAHETLVRNAGLWFQAQGISVSNPHPIDLLVTAPHRLIIEAKVVGKSEPIFAVREAVGQLHEYRYFIGPTDSQLCILLSSAPNSALVKYIEEELNLLIIWSDGIGFKRGPNTSIALSTP